MTDAQYQSFEYVVVTIPWRETMADHQRLITESINRVARHGWRLVDGPRFESGLMNGLNSWIATFERPKEWSAVE